QLRLDQIPRFDDLESWGHAVWIGSLCRELDRDWTLQQLGPVMSVAEAARVLASSTRTVITRIHDGRLNAWKDTFTNRWFIPREERNPCCTGQRIACDLEAGAREHRSYGTFSKASSRSRDRAT